METPTDEEATSTANLTVRLSTATDTKPATLVPRATPIFLTWQGPKGEQTLYSRENPDGIPVAFPHPIASLDRDETFVVKTSAGGVDRYDSVTVAVDEPYLPGLRADSLIGTPALILTGLSVTCTNTLNVAALVKTGKTCTVDRAVTVSAQVTTPTLTTTGAITTTGTNPRITADSLVVTGALQSDDTLDARKGVVNILGEPIVRNAADHIEATPATTDGFLVGSVPYARIRLEDSTRASAFDAGEDHGGHATAALPVHRGDNYLGVVESQYGQKAHFAFYPIGKP
jgi:hypothetical protein